MSSMWPTLSSLLDFWVHVKLARGRILGDCLPGSGILYPHPPSEPCSAHYRLQLAYVSMRPLLAPAQHRLKVASVSCNISRLEASSYEILCHGQSGDPKLSSSRLSYENGVHKYTTCARTGHQNVRTVRTKEIRNHLLHFHFTTHFCF